MIHSELAKDGYQTGDGDILLRDLYRNPVNLTKQRQRLVNAIEAFESYFGPKEISIFSAPGRSELCGNHTDHQRGIVLAASVELDTLAVVAKRDDDTIKIISDGYEPITISLLDFDKRDKEIGTTTSLVRGILCKLHSLGYVLGGFEAYLTSNVPVGVGLASSASFEIAIGTIISGLYNQMSIDAITLAKVAQYAENVYYEKPCGLMDQMACSVGGILHIDFADPNAPIIRNTNTTFEDYNYSLCIVTTKSSHVELTEDYAQIPKEMSEISEHFGKKYLRECDPNDFYSNISELRKSYGDRAVLRAFHFFDEMVRVERATKALQDNDFTSFLLNIQQSGHSSFRFLQNVYSIKDVTQQSLSLASALSEHILQHNGVCRIHGGGFEGGIQAFIKNDYVKRYRTEMDTVFGQGSCLVLRIRKQGAIQII